MAESHKSIVWIKNPDAWGTRVMASTWEEPTATWVDNEDSTALTPQW